MTAITRRNRHPAFDLPSSECVTGKLEGLFIHVAHAGLPVVVVRRMARSVVPNGNGNLKRVFAGIWCPCSNLLEQNISLCESDRTKLLQLLVELLFQCVHAGSVRGHGQKTGTANGEQR